MPEKKELEEAKKSKKKKVWYLWIMGALLLLAGLFFSQYAKMQKEMRVRQEGMRVQEEKLRSFYEEQGLSEAEIESKLREERSANIKPDQNSDPFRSIMRTVRHTTGTGGQPMNR